MFSHETPIRYANQSHTNVGVAPSRHDLALRDYLERRKKLAARGTQSSITVAVSSILKRAAVGLVEARYCIRTLAIAPQRVAQTATIWVAWLIALVRQ